MKNHKNTVRDEHEGQVITVVGVGNFKIQNGRRIWLEQPPEAYYLENRNL